MSESEKHFELPSRGKKDDGSTRRVGFEIEFSGITVEEAAASVQSALGGKLRVDSAAERTVHVDSLGKFNVEIDWEYLKRAAANEDETQLSPEWIERLSSAATIILPIEVVCPPIPMTELTRLNPLVDALRDAGAVGTEESLVAAYGVHINPEVPALDLGTLLAYIKAFALLQWWLVDQHEVDATRKVSSFVDLYSEAYVKQVVASAEASPDTIFDDYLAHNATRNRALDLLPLLAELDEARVRRAVDDPRIKARPTFHYRLANSHIERPGWSLIEPWNTWVVVERVAEHPEALDELAASFLAADRPILGVSRKEWVGYLNRWLKDHELA